MKVKVICNVLFIFQDYIFNGIFGFIVGFKFFYIVQYMVEMQGDLLVVVFFIKGSWFGGLLGVGLFIGYYYYID